MNFFKFKIFILENLNVFDFELIYSLYDNEQNHYIWRCKKTGIEKRVLNVSCPVAPRRYETFHSRNEGMRNILREQHYFEIKNKLLIWEKHQA